MLGIIEEQPKIMAGDLVLTVRRSPSPQDNETPLLESNPIILQDYSSVYHTLKSLKLDSQQRDDFVEERGRLIRRREVLQQELNIQSPLQVYLKYKELIVLMGK